MARIVFTIILVLGVSAGFVGNTLAQGTSAPKAQGETSEISPDTSRLIAPYDNKLMRLSEVLGSIHFLRELCKANEGQLWREKMAALIEAEKPRPARKSRMIARFNLGYGVFSGTYRRCTPAALMAVNRYMKEGVRLASQITARYGRSF